MTKLSKLSLAFILGSVSSTSYATDIDTLQSQLKQLQQQMKLLEQKLVEEKSKQQKINEKHQEQVALIEKKADQNVAVAEAPKEKSSGIKAVLFVLTLVIHRMMTITKTAAATLILTFLDLIFLVM